MQRVFGFHIGRYFGFGVVVVATFVAAVASAQMAQRQPILNISLDGSYEQLHDEDSDTTKTSLGGELGLPLSSFFELAVGHILSVYREDYTDNYRQKILEYYGRYGLTDADLPRDLIRETTVMDTSLNAVVGYPIQSFKPAIFGGKLWRKVCKEDTFEDKGCASADVTWNAGVALSVMVTRALRLQLSYRISPSVRDDRKSFDDRTAVGLTWGL